MEQCWGFSLEEFFKGEMLKEMRDPVLLCVL